MNLAYLQTFVIVAKERSFTRAAESLGVSKGLVSRHVQKLEETLATRLLLRTTRSINLTEAGEALLVKASQIQLLATEAEMQVRDLTQELSGDLRVTAPFEFGRALCRHVIPEFTALYPKVNLILDFGPKRRQIEAGDFDVAFRAYDELPKDVVARDLGYIRNVLVCSSAFAESSRPGKIADLHRCRFILNSQNERWNQLELVSDDRRYTVEVTGGLSVNTYAAMLQLVQSGMGLASLPYYQVEELLEKGELIQVLPQWSVKTHSMSLIYAQRRVTPQKLTTFNQAVQRWLGANELFLI
ncbi:LysR family transcriptional regulator [Ferrimonas futtsuensis]|uniref:LysR family transcriptional regulator n=1 Tax=Ferrimonas futtsuensis TaxID=364764 RepID=UPI0003FE65A3|nr:LysR family transcriptional regulator [Ferrimonas futtsuensis]